MSRIYLVTVLFLVLGGFIGYSLGLRVNLNASKSTPTTEANRPINQFLSEPMVGRLKVDVPEEYRDTLVDAQSIYALPEQPSANDPTGNIKGLKPFDMNEAFGELSLSVPESIESRVFSEVEIDIDNDQRPEKAIFYTVTGAGALHFLRMVKDDKVIFEYMGSALNVNQVHGLTPGFVISTETPQDRNGYRIRYIINEDGIIVPLWQQRYIGIE